MDLIESGRKLTRNLQGLTFSPPVAYVYQPMEYAGEPHEEYLRRFGSGPKRVVFMGMNPGPYGMTQTGVPFGEIAAVRDWIGIEMPVRKPDREHPKRPIDGFACQRSEVSGRRLWGLFAARFGNAETFFKEHFVLNYCPLVWMSETGANLTPDKIRAVEMLPVEQACQRHLMESIEILRPQYLIGVGAYAEARLQRAVLSLGIEVTVGKILHPSPASPAANRGWAEAATKQLEALGVWGENIEHRTSNIERRI